MAEYTVKEIETVRDIPGNPQEKGGPAKVLKLSVEEDERQPELFTVASTPLPEIGKKYEGEIEDDPKWGPKFVRPKKGGAKSFGRSPAENKKIVRQHSQHMSLLREANLIAAGRPPFTRDELVAAITFFENDAHGKQNRGVEIDGTTSDVPADMSGTPFEEK